MHRARDIVAIWQFTARYLWLPNNSDLNLVDYYKVWVVTQEHVYCTPILDVADLNRRPLAALPNFKEFSTFVKFGFSVNGKQDLKWAI